LLVYMLCFVVLMKWLAYDLALVFLLLRFSLRVRFFLHLALILGCCGICQLLVTMVSWRAPMGSSKYSHLLRMRWDEGEKEDRSPARSCTVKLIVCAGQRGPRLGDGQRLESSQRQVLDCYVAFITCSEVSQPFAAVFRSSNRFHRLLGRLLSA
jgi:hypothetical protein